MEVQVEGIWPIVGGWYLGGLNSRIMRSRGRPAAGGTVRAGTWENGSGSRMGPMRWLMPAAWVRRRGPDLCSGLGDRKPHRSHISNPLPFCGHQPCLSECPGSCVPTIPQEFPRCVAPLCPTCKCGSRSPSMKLRDSPGISSSALCKRPAWGSPALGSSRGLVSSSGDQALTGVGTQDVLRMSSPAGLGGRSASPARARARGRGGPAAAALQRRWPPDLPCVISAEGSVLTRGGLQVISQLQEPLEKGGR